MGKKSVHLYSLWCWFCLDSISILGVNWVNESLGKRKQYLLISSFDRNVGEIVEWQLVSALIQKAAVKSNN
ncbi:hypothetical protein BpHYR1_034142 [Brachionus plicatilis]|uniref:Uncharacterized protein n=1 Tax=Brachionus plicatilis TaxID=10195 RepID=A0A3M7S6X8_BRAPC|nr:hypothetical protein BpHYR1_034142 [Brachionus plicatilis]